MIKDLRIKSDIELAELITKLKTQLLEIRFKIANGENKNLNKIGEIKKTIAISMTVLSERKAKLSYTAYETRIIKIDEKGEQKFIPIKSLMVNKKTINKINEIDRKHENKKTIDKKELTKNNFSEDLNKKVKAKKVTLKKKPLQSKKNSAKG